MKYEELVETVRKAVQNVVVSKTFGHVAYQVNIEGEAEGAFYIEIDHGKIIVEPYEYYDRDVIIVTTADVLMHIIKRKVKLMDAYASGQIKVYGNLECLSYFTFV